MELQVVTAAIVNVVKEYSELIKSGKTFNMKPHLEALDMLKKKLERIPVGI